VNPLHGVERELPRGAGAPRTPSESITWS